MTITRKPQPQSAAPSPDVEAVISKGGSVAKRRATPEKDITPVVLRTPTPLLQQVDQLLEGLTIKKPRHTWILEAIAEKLERDLK